LIGNYQRWGEKLFVHSAEYSLGQAILDADGEISLAELKERGWLTIDAMMQLRECGAHAKTLETFLRYNQLPKVELASAYPRYCGWLDASARITYLMDYIDQLSRDDYKEQAESDSSSSSDSDD
jgi:hypothetical protein